MHMHELVMDHCTTVTVTHAGARALYRKLHGVTPRESPVHLAI